MAAELQAGDSATADPAVVEVVEVTASAEAPGTPAAQGEECPATAPPEGNAAQIVAGEKTPAVTDMVKCRRCSQEVAIADALCTAKFRPELRYTCRPCHAVCSQLQRRGVDIKEVLSESAAVTFFVDAKNERANGMEGRLCYGQSRALLLQKMIESTSHVEKDGSDGAFQPLSHWMLQGYDCDRIQALAETREHPILGTTYRVDIDKMSREQIRTITEERLLNIESQARERLQSKNAVCSASSAAAPTALADLGVEVEEATVATVATGKKRKTPEEKQAAAEAAKQQRQEDKKRQKLERTATSAAAKLLPQLKKCGERLNDLIGKVSTIGAGLPEATAEDVAKTQKTLEETVKNATHMLGAAAKGQGVQLEADALHTEKSLNTILKDGNGAIRSLQFYIRENKEHKAPKENQTGRAAKAKAKK